MLFKYRKCPECGSRNYEKGQTGSKIITFKNGKRITRTIWCDAGYFECLKCGYREHG